MLMEMYSLHFAGVLLTFMLKVTAGFVLCTALASLMPNPRQRFLTWLIFIFTSGFVWFTTLADEVIAFLASPGAASGRVTASIAGGEHFTVPARWAVLVEGMMLAVLAIYAAAVVVRIGVRVYKHVRLRTWLRHARRPSPELEATFREVCREFNVRSCRLMVLPQASSPATVYWWTPRVVVPEICEQLAGTAQLRNVLRHELIHTLRCDYLWASLCDLVCDVLFFIPAMWTARNHLSMQRELACDLGVVESHPELRADYAASLARFMRLMMMDGPALSFGIDFVPAPSFLGTRIRCILAEPRKEPRWKRVFADTAFVAAIVIFVGVSPALSISIDLSPDTAQSTVAVPSRTSPIKMKAIHGSMPSPAGATQQQLRRTSLVSHSLTTLPPRRPAARDSSLSSFLPNQSLQTLY